jgi:hypothetical protein
VLLLGVLVAVVPAFAHFDDLTSNPFSRRLETTVKTTTNSDGEVVERTTTPTDESLVEVALGGGGLLLLRLVAVAGAAFVAGAVVQHGLLGRFGFKAGGVEIPELTDVASTTEEGLAALREELRGVYQLSADAAQLAGATALKVADLVDRPPGPPQL